MYQFSKLLAAILAVLLQSALACNATGRDLHIDAPLSNVVVEAFTEGANFVAGMLFPTVPVAKQSDVYYVIGKETWLKVPQSTLRAPKTSPRRIEFDVSSDTYFAANYAIAHEIPDEDTANADSGIQLWERATRFATRTLLQDYELRVANQVSSISNIGSGVSLSGANKWSNFAGSNPISDVTTGHAFIRQNTGLRANTLLIDEDTYQTVRRHPVILDMFKYTAGGLVTDDQLKSVFRVQNLLVPDGIYNSANEGAAATVTNIWGNIALLARVEQGASLQTQTFGLGYRWTPPNMPAPMQAFRYRDSDPGKKLEIVEVGYYQAEKIVAKQLAYAIKSTL